MSGGVTFNCVLDLRYPEATAHLKQIQYRAQESVVNYERYILNIDGKAQ